MKTEKTLRARFVDVPIEVCCVDMGSIMMFNDLRESVLYNKQKDRFEICWSDGDCSPLRYCPCCGKEVRKRV